jgi:hypothetical protein
MSKSKHSSLHPHFSDIKAGAEVVGDRARGLWELEHPLFDFS